MSRPLTLALHALLGATVLLPAAAWASKVGINGGACTYGTIEDAAAAASSGDELFVSPGSYSEDTISLTTTDLTITSSDSTCATRTSRQVTILPTAGQRGFEVYNSRLVLDGVTVQNANTSLAGAAIFVHASSTLVLDDSVLQQNASGSDGGCIYAVDTHITLLNDSELDRCDATGDGGGAYLDDSTLWIFAGSSVHGSSAIGGDGGGLYLDATDAYIKGDVADNDAVNGGGIYVWDWSGSYTSISLSDSASLARNTASSHGGGLYISGATNRVHLFDDAVIEDNTADFGGGMYARYNSEVSLNERAAVLRNHATSTGGGIYGHWNNQLVIEGDDIGDIQIRGNTSDGDGGGIYLEGADLDASFATIRSNVAVGDGGGLGATLLVSAFAPLPSNVTLRNVRVLDNEALKGAGVLIDDSVLDMRSQFSTCSTSSLAKDRFCSEIRGNTAVGTSSRGGGLRMVNGGTGFVGTTSFVLNEAGVGGGAIAVRDSGSELTLRNALVRANQASGTAVWARDGKLEVFSSTFVDNDTPIELVTGATGAFSRNIVWDNTNDSVLPGITGDCNTTQTTGGAPSGTANNTLDPVFDATDPRSSWKLDSTSPAIDACLTGPGRDLDGATRPSGGAFDKGAFEM